MFKILLKVVAKIILYAVFLTVAVLGIDVVGLWLARALSNLFWILAMEGIFMVGYSVCVFQAYRLTRVWLDSERDPKLPAHPAMGIAMAVAGCFLFVLGLFCYG